MSSWFLLSTVMGTLFVTRIALHRFNRVFQRIFEFDTISLLFRCTAINPPRELIRGRGTYYNVK